MVVSLCQAGELENVVKFGWKQSRLVICTHKQRENETSLSKEAVIDGTARERQRQRQIEAHK